MTIHSVLPRHNDKLFTPATHRACIERLADLFTVEALEAGIEGYQRKIDHNHGIEFDDTRTRHWDGCAISALKEAIALKATIR